MCICLNLWFINWKSWYFSLKMDSAIEKCLMPTASQGLDLKRSLYLCKQYRQKLDKAGTALTISCRSQTGLEWGGSPSPTRGSPAAPGTAASAFTSPFVKVISFCQSRLRARLQNSSYPVFIPDFLCSLLLVAVFMFSLNSLHPSHHFLFQRPKFL